MSFYKALFYLTFFYIDILFIVSFVALILIFKNIALKYYLFWLLTFFAPSLKFYFCLAFP